LRPYRLARSPDSLSEHVAEVRDFTRASSLWLRAGSWNHAISRAISTCIWVVVSRRWSAVLSSRVRQNQRARRHPDARGDRGPPRYRTAGGGHKTRPESSSVTTGATRDCPAGSAGRWPSSTEPWRPGHPFGLTA